LDLFRISILGFRISSYEPQATSLSSTLVECALQNHPFMQNEPNFRKSQMNVCPVNTMDYDKKTLGERGKNEPKTNPIKANFRKAKMNVNKVLAENYENISPIIAPKKQSQFSKRQKPMQTFLPKRIMKNTRFRVLPKRTQNEPNQSQFPKS